MKDRRRIIVKAIIDLNTKDTPDKWTISMKYIPKKTEVAFINGMLIWACRIWTTVQKPFEVNIDDLKKYEQNRK